MGAERRSDNASVGSQSAINAAAFLTNVIRSGALQPHSSELAARAATMTAACRAALSRDHSTFHVPGPATPGACSVPR